MKIIRRIGALALVTVVSASAFAADTEALRYSWRLKGGLRFIAGLMFPTSGVGNLTTRFGKNVESELLITAPNGKQGGFYSYESEIDGQGKTLMTSHGYAWGNKSRTDRTVFDYSKGLARITKQTPEEIEHKVRKLPAGDQQFRDVLTAIYFLRQNASRIQAPMQTDIFSDGKQYPVIFRPGASRSFMVEGKPVNARSFEIVDAPGGKKWPGAVTVWLTSDDRRLPVRIEIQQSMASMQLDLQRIESRVFLARL